MVRFFALHPLPAAAEAALDALSLRQQESDGPRRLKRWEVDDSLVVTFLLAAAQAGVRVFHDATFQPPQVEGCQGGQIFGNELQRRLRARHTLSGRGALVIIADSGVYRKELEVAHFRFDRNVVGPAAAGGNRTHGTMCLLDAFLGAPDAVFGELRVSTTATAVSSDLLSAFAGLNEGSESFNDYHARIVSLSLGVPAENAAVDHRLPANVKLTMNAEHPLWIETTALIGKGFDVVIAAGNDGCTTGAISGLALHPSVLTVAAVDGGNHIEPRSSRGVSPHKPDFSACTNFLWSQLYGRGSYDSGTSAATALAAGLVASLRDEASGRSWRDMSSGQLRDFLRATVVKTIGDGSTLTEHSAAYGWGIL